MLPVLDYLLLCCVDFENKISIYLSLTSKWRGTFQYFQSHVKIAYIYYLEKPPPI